MELDIKELKMCRVCLQTGSDKFCSLFDKFNSLSIHEHINSLTCLSIMVEDGLPNQICDSCLEELKTCIGFKQKCESSNKILLENIKIPVENYNIDVIKKEEIGEDYECYLDVEEIWTDLVQTQSSEDSDVKIELKTEKESPQCHDCGQTFLSKCKLRVHWKKNHNQKTFLCPICKRLFKSLKTYNKHMKAKPTSCSDLFKGGIAVEGEGVTRTFSCPQCDYKTKKIIHMRSHLVTHTKEKLFRCEICGKAYSQSSSLKTHLEGKHFEKSSLKGCHICGKLFKGNSRLYKHIKTHSSEVYECEICKKSIKGKKSLKVHMSRHSGVKAFTCELCAASFYNSAELCNHRKKHTRPGEPYKMKLHKCDICDYKTSKYRLKLHMQKHVAGDKPYFCTECGTFFLTLQKLTAHERLHIESKKFSCPLCDKQFFCRRSVSKHVIIKHKSRMLQNRRNPVPIKEESSPLVK